MRVPIGADIGQFEIPAFIGQAPAALPVFAQMAARNSWPLKNESALFDNVGNFIVTRDGSEIARYARPVSNTVYNEFLPKPGKWIPVMYYYGAKPGGINFVPMDKFLARANVISDQVIEEVLAQMPGPMTIESPMTNAGFWDSISSGMELAQQALDEARGGNWKLASVRLNAKGAGARAYLDRANATARTLSDLGLMDYNKYVQSAILDLGGLITQATMAIGTQKAGGILAWVDAFKYVFANTIAAEAIVLEDNFVKFTNMYATAFRALVDQVATQKKLAPHVPSMGPAERKYYDESNAIILDIRKELGKMDAQLESVGINPQEFRDQAGLEGQLEGLGFWGPVIRVGSKVIGWIGTKLGFKKAAQTAASATGKKTFQEIPIIGQTAAQTAARGAARYGDQGLAALVAAAGKKPFWKKAMGWVLGLPLAIVGFTLGGHWLEKLFGLRERSLEEIQKELLQYEEARKGLPEYAARVDKAHVLAPEAQEHIGPRVARMETYLGNLDSVTQQLDNLAELTKSPSLKAKADRARDKAEGATSKSKAVGNQVGADVKTPVALRPDAKEDDKTILYILGGGLAVGLIYHLFLKKK